MRIFLRNSKKDNIDAKEYFRVISTGIKFFEKLIGVEFPFEKYDSIFCPEYRIGAMENVGAITFNDGYLQPKDAQTELLRVSFHYVALHELSHMWFGDLVTMEWWTDLWLKESFADFLGATNMMENPDLQNYQNADILFVRYLQLSLEADIKKTTHPIQVNVRHTEDAANVFDSICYEKGACFIKQMSHYVGRDILRDAMKEYFTKFAYKNTELSDFVQCLENAATKFGKTDLGIAAWTESWLTKAGANELQVDFGGIDYNTGQGSIKVKQSYPCAGDKAYHS